MTEPGSEMDPGPDGRVPGTMATVLDLTNRQAALDPEMSFTGWTVPATGQVLA